jgi:hypothetical protein
MWRILVLIGWYSSKLFIEVNASPPEEQIRFTLVPLRGKTWMEAESYCWNVYGKHLAMILNQDEANEARNIVQGVPNVWIGLHEQWNQDQWNQAGNKRTWVWSSNSSLAIKATFAAWTGSGNPSIPPDPPLNDLRPRCAKISYYGNWEAVSCNDYPDTGGFLCDKVTEITLPRVAPFVQEGHVLTSPTELAPGSFDGFGSYIAINSDGTILLVGSPKEDNNIGTTFIFFRGDGNWTMQGKLVGFDYERSSGQGSAVAISNSGDVVLIGGPRDALNTGAGWIFMREDDDKWHQFGSKLVGDDASLESAAGSTVALSGDGEYAAIAGYAKNDGETSIWIFQRSSGGYVQLGSKLAGWGSYEKISFDRHGNYVVTKMNTTHVRISARNGELWTPKQDIVGDLALMSDDGQILGINGKNSRSGVREITLHKLISTGSWVQQGTGFSVSSDYSYSYNTLLGMSGDGSRIIAQMNNFGYYNGLVSWMGMYDFTRGGKILPMVSSEVLSKWYSTCNNWGSTVLFSVAVDGNAKTTAIAIGTNNGYCKSFVAIIHHDVAMTPTTNSPTSGSIVFSTSFPTPSSLKPTRQPTSTPLKIVAEPTPTPQQQPSPSSMDLDCSTLLAAKLCKVDSRCKWKNKNRKCINVSVQNIRQG